MNQIKMITVRKKVKIRVPKNFIKNKFKRGKSLKFNRKIVKL